MKEPERKQRPAESHRSGLSGPAAESIAPVAQGHSALKAKHPGDALARRRLRINHECNTHASAASGRKDGNAKDPFGFSKCWIENVEDCFQDNSSLKD